MLTVYEHNLVRQTERRTCVSRFKIWTARYPSLSSHASAIFHRYEAVAPLIRATHLNQQALRHHERKEAAALYVSKPGKAGVHVNLLTAERAMLGAQHQPEQDRGHPYEEHYTRHCIFSGNRQATKDGYRCVKIDSKTVLALSDLPFSAYRFTRQRFVEDRRHLAQAPRFLARAFRDLT